MGDSPETTFRAGVVSASVFVNTYEKNGEQREMLSINLQRSYQKDGEWKRTNNLGRDDIPKAILVLQKAYEYAYMQRKKDSGGSYQGNSPSADTSGPSSDGGEDTSPF